MKKKVRLQLEAEVKNLSSQFKPSSTFIDPDKSEKDNTEETQLFELSSFLEGASEKNRDFVFDSETARNFDQENINRAKQGVKELMADTIAKAKSQAIEIKEQAQKEGKNAGHEEGYQAGFQKGENKAKEDYGPLLETLNNLIRDLSEFRKMMFPKVEKEMVGMVIDLTKKILHHEINLREDSVKEMILLATNSVIDKENMTIRIHPSDKKYAEEFRPELQSLFGEIKNVNFEGNSGVERGSCVIETNFGTVTASINQLEEQIGKILKFTPTVPEVIPSIQTLSDKTTERETEKNSESISQNIEDTTTVEKESEILASKTSMSESKETITTETPDSEAQKKEDLEEISEKGEDLTDSKNDDG